MKYFLKLFFISIALSFLTGTKATNNLFISEVGDPHFGTSAETLYLYNDVPELERDTSLTHYNLPQLSIVHIQRHLTKRPNHSFSQKNYLFINKGKDNKDYYNSLLFPESHKRFPFWLTEARQYLISLGRLII